MFNISEHSKTDYSGQKLKITKSFIKPVLGCINRFLIQNNFRFGQNR